MSKRGWLIIAIYIVILLVAGVVLFGKKVFPQEKVHHHAGFIVFKDDKKLDFSDNKFMDIKPCTDKENENHAEEDEQMEKAHLHDNLGDVVHVEANDAKWKDLFTNIKFAIDYTKATAFVNGQKVVNFQDQLINPYDSIVVFIGNIDKTQLKEAVKKEHIMQVEKKSDNCGT